MEGGKIGIRDEIFVLAVSCMERSRETDNVEKVKQMRKSVEIIYFTNQSSFSLISNAFNKQEHDNIIETGPSALPFKCIQQAGHGRSA
ncbi:hypothetical protein GOBAR_AA22796 [Gossypium barbadense]|uniref:Uncharacterized protein n=1 Tax=Gossypium barbadense TaxID=3634 RepID=A0A2P5X3F8_GOSBA|nr:hypothetical protein GOBAR_AA22796 [Gossypium barbadense]